MTMTDHEKTPSLTKERLEYCDRLFDKLSPLLSKLQEVQEPGTFWIYPQTHISFTDLYSKLVQKEVTKVSKLKIGDRYRKDVEGWIVPDGLVSEFNQCIEVSSQYRELRYKATDVASKIPRNGYERIEKLSPEKMQQFIDFFEN